MEDGNDLEAIDAALTEAAQPDGRPTLIATRTHIGYGSPNKQDTSKAHGSPLGAEEVAATKRVYGWPEDAQFLVPDEVAAWRDEMTARGQGMSAQWRERFDAYAAAHAEEAAEFARVMEGRLPDGLGVGHPGVPRRRVDRDAGLGREGHERPRVRRARAHPGRGRPVDVHQHEPGGPGRSSSAATTPAATSTTACASTRWAPSPTASRPTAAWRPTSATFFTFSDYMKNPIRLAALMELPSIFVFTHDSVGLGRGRADPPADRAPGRRCGRSPASSRSGPPTPTRRRGPGAWRSRGATGRRRSSSRRQGLHTLPGPIPVERGAYVLEDGDDCILIATGSEVGVAREARGVLAGDGISARVVSMPSFELFRAQERSYRDEVLPPSLTARVAVEAASPFGWARVGRPRPARWSRSTGSGRRRRGRRRSAALGITSRAVAEAAKAQVGR